MKSKLNDQVKLKKVKRSIYSYTVYLLAFLFCSYKFKEGNANWLNYYWIILSFIFFLLLLRMIIRPNYFEVKLSKLIMYKEFFQKDILEIKDIKGIKLGLTPFSNSFILFKTNKQTKKFNLFHLNEKDLNILLKENNIKVE